MNLPLFEALEIKIERENEKNEVAFIGGASRDALRFYIDFFEGLGFIKKEERVLSDRAFSAYEKDGDGVFFNYFERIGELYITYEQKTLYFDKNDEPCIASAVPQITQIKLEDYGMSYAIRLSDGRYIVIDGGREFEPDAERLYSCLACGTPSGKPKIAVWIMTHPHSDHFHCFLPFFDTYGDRVEIESFMLNFPERGDTEHYPKLTAKDPRFEDSSPFTNIKRLFDRIERTGAPIYTPHTGQTYRFGDASLLILASMDDTIHNRTGNINATSTVIRMELAGQVILWGADMPCSEARLAEKYGEYLKSDILQVPHHGFQSGEADGELRAYKLIKPKTAFIPASDFNAFTAFCIHKPGARYLMESCGISELITGENQRTVDLPYEPDEDGKAALARKVSRGLANCGAYNFIFSDLNTANPDDFVFTFLNTTHVAATIFAELFFEDYNRDVRAIKIDVGPLRQRTLSVIGDETDHDALYFNWMSLSARGIPESASFSIRFISNVPVVISNKHRAAVYYS